MPLSRRLRCSLAALASVVAAGVAASGAGAATIVFGGETDSTIIVTSSGSGDDSPQGLQLNVSPSNGPLPQTLAIQVPAGYTIDLSAVAGTTIADARLFIASVDSPSFATASGPLVAQDPGTYVTDPAAQACAAGLHAAVWSLSVPIAGQPVNVTFFVDGSRADGYTLQSCPTGLATGTTSSVTSISLAGLGVLDPPTAKGDYVWHAVVTPRGAAAYELQALVPLPESVTVSGRYDSKKRAAVLTGRVIEGGKPVPHADVFIGSSDEDSFGADAVTGSDGRFTARQPIARTTDFNVTVSPSGGPCAGTSTAPGGCLGSLTVPPDAGGTTVWVSVPGGAVRATRAADRRLAERERLAAADFPAGFSPTGSTEHACENPTGESDLTITGETVSPTFIRFEQGDAASIVSASGLVRVYATAKQARSAFDREAVTATARCLLRDTGTKKQKLRTFRLSGLPARVRGFGATFVAGELKVDVDIVFLQRGRSVQRLSFALAGTSRDIERSLAAKVARRMR